MSDTIPDSTPQKQCYLCKEFFPATRQFFYANKKDKKDGLMTRCKTCQEHRSQPRYKAKEGYKRCSKCKEEFPVEFFHSDKSEPGGLSYICKQCTKIKTKQRYQSAKERPVENRPDELTCKVCNTPKPATEEYFFNNPTILHGLQNTCKECRDKQRRQYAQEHPEKIAEGRRGAYQRQKARGTLYYVTHANRVRLKNQRYYQTHKTQYIERSKRRAKTEKGKLNAKTGKHTRRAREKMAEGRFTVSDVRRQLKAQKSKCYWCGVKLGTGKNAYHIDHIIPIARGGSNWPDNLVISCGPCNLSKQARLPSEWPQGNRLL